MAQDTGTDQPPPREPLDALLEHALLLDLEVSHEGKILRIGATLGHHVFDSVGIRSSSQVLETLAQLAANARSVLGHNLVRHDLPILCERQPRHPLLRLPVIDTLVLSPIAFPENPYHRLVKDYKLVSESLNNPVADARQAATLFHDEFRSLAGLRQTEPDLFDLLRFLLTTPDDERDTSASGLTLVFKALGGTTPPPSRALQLWAGLFHRWACSSVPVTAALFASSAQRLALAYATTWLRVAGSNSVLPPWVRHEHPLVGQLLDRLRDVPCNAPDCAYCQKVHNASAQLRTFFGHSEFRPVPTSPSGGSLQQDIVEAGLRGVSLLAILPTGGGKSLCFQLPALVRNYRRGTLTIVISPLQALMKDQVDGLARRTGTPFAAALYGLLTPPERGDVLRRIRLGDVALLYVSPEQLRNRSFRDAIAQREVGCWVFDEAHCLSKWGHDFRPDYLYAGRFIRRFSKSQGVIPPIACFTATAKRDVKEEIIAYFKAETGRDLKLFEGGVERENLRFEVQTVTGHTKLERIHDLLSDRLPSRQAASAIVFRATRTATRETAEYLRNKGWLAAHFHAGLTPPEKKRVQDEFLAGAIRVICATNAFGMGIDKEDVRLVIHADTPGSLENYLQEAGRAGRDGQTADCLLLYNEEDCEHQFRMGAFSELSRRDIAHILRGLRKAARGSPNPIVITSGEILRDEDVAAGITFEDSSADTKVRTAISWLERAGFLERDENVTSVFQARPLVRDLAEAESRMAGLNLSISERALWLAILRELMNAGSADSLTVDQLALLPEFVNYARPPAQPRQADLRLQEKPAAYVERVSHDYLSAKIIRILRNLAQAGLVKRDTLLNAFVSHKVPNHSRIRLDHLLETDRKLVDLLAIEEPDPEGWMPLCLRILNQRLCDDGCRSSTELVRQLLRSLSEDGRGFAGSRGSLELRFVSRDSYRVRLHRSWTALGELAEKRRRVATLILDVLLAKIPGDTPASSDLLVAFSFEELHDAIDRDLLLRSELKDIDVAIERALMYLHEQRIIALQQGLAIFRSAMTIRLQPDSKGQRYTHNHYQPLHHHYRERVFQVHVMSEFARRGLARIREALSLVLAYFTLDKETFIRRFLGTKPELLEHATTAQSFQRIVSDLANAAQLKVVTAPTHHNLLVLAGPGSGKTRTVVHRCAYLLRVERVRPESVLVCCFNRHAAIELRRRLADLVGQDARGVTVLTYHSLALRLLGRSFTNRARSREPDFDALIAEAVKLLRGESVHPGIEPDDVRDRLLAGFQYILVDEYQDIDEPQYELISALAGRTLDDPDLKLAILAVGDDDQNIYGFRGANVQFIRRFQRDYDAQPHYLVENYRSTRYIIEAANQLIGANTDRMKSEHPIRIDRHRELQHPGGDFGRNDPLTEGRVQIIRVHSESHQASAVIAELQRLMSLANVDWSNVAVLSRTHRELAQVRSLAERQHIPVRWWADRNKLPPLHHVREIHRFIQRLAKQRTALLRAGDLRSLADELNSRTTPNPWIEYLHRLIDSWQTESDDAELPAQEAIEFLYESCSDDRRDFTFGHGVTLSTVHAAKGTEYDHVLLVGTWPLDPRPVTCEELRRTFYVGMTRARLSLTLFDQTLPTHERSSHPDRSPRREERPGVNEHFIPPSAQTSLLDALIGPAFLRNDTDAGPEPDSLPPLDYTVLGLDDIHLGFPASFRPDHPIHAALASLQPGDLLTLTPDPRGIRILDSQGTCVARLSRKAEEAWRTRLNAIREIRLLAMIHRTADQDSDTSCTHNLLVSSWEIPIVEILFA